MSACTPTATISVKEAVLAPKPIVLMPLLQRGGLSFTSARDQRSHVLTMYAQNAIRSAQTTILPRISPMMSRIRDCNRSRTQRLWRMGWLATRYARAHQLEQNSGGVTSPFYPQSGCDC